MNAVVALNAFVASLSLNVLKLPDWGDLKSHTHQYCTSPKLTQQPHCSVNISGDSLCVTYRLNEKKCIRLGSRMSEDKWKHLYVSSSRLFNLFPVEPFASVINRHNKSTAVTLLLSWWTLRGMTPVWPLHLLAQTAQHIPLMGFTRNHLQCK